MFVSMMMRSAFADQPTAPAPVSPSDAVLVPAVIRGPAGGSGGPATGALPSIEELEASGAHIGSINIAVEDIFDESDPREDNAIYRLANDLHLRTRDYTVAGQLLFDEGDTFSAHDAEESARILRSRRYLSEATVEPVAYDADSNTVDLEVRVRDVWSLSPGISFSRKGGENKSRLRVVDENFLGLGQYLSLGYSSTVDRSGLALDFKDQNVRNSWWAVEAGYADTSDGSIASFGLGRPFYSLDTRWSFGTRAASIEQNTPLYDLGEKVNEFSDQNKVFEISGGISRGLVNGWTTRWLAGYRYDRSEFAPLPEPGATVLLPENRELSYPWVGVEIVQDRFQTTHNHDQIGRTEDLFLGRQLRAELGWAAPAFGSDRSAGIFALAASTARPLGEHGLLFVEGRWNGRLEDGSTADGLLQAETRYYHRFDEKNLFTASITGASGSNLDLDHQLQLGGDTGLRGYPLRYQNGDASLLLSVEQRYFTDWFPFRLFRVGAAVFADTGRTWGQAPLATEPQGWLSDVGFGLRLGNMRSGLANVLHLDLAFPIGASSDVDSMQLILEAQRSF